MLSIKRLLTVFFVILVSQLFAQNDIARLTSAMLGPTPIAEDLHELCDKIGGRVTGTEPNEKAVEWAIQKFKDVGVDAKKEAFQMPSFWNETSAKAEINGEISFSPKIVSRAFSIPTPKEGLKGELISIGYGNEEDFKKLGDKAKGKFILVQTNVLEDLSGLFGEYDDAAKIEARAEKAGVKGIIYMSSREKKLLFRHLAAKAYNNKLLLVVMARDDATRCQRVLDRGGKLNIALNLDIQTGGSYTSHNVIAEIKGSEKPDEIILVGAHLDSWGLGTGANDNGCNVSMMIDLARQMKKLGIQPKRTIRFALWNGEEQCICGSQAYTQQHEDELDKHRMTISIDIGSGDITGYLSGGRPDVAQLAENSLKSVPGLGPFTIADVPIVGTDNYDFMVQGVPNLIGAHENYNYCSNYHSESDTYDKVNLSNLKANAAIVASSIMYFANEDYTPAKRQNRAEIQKLIDSTTLKDQMKAFHFLKPWEDGSRGRKP